MADMDVPIGIGRAVVEDVLPASFAPLPESFINIPALPPLEHDLFHLSEVCLHREIGLRKIERVFIIHSPWPLCPLFFKANHSTRHATVSRIVNADEIMI